MNPFRKAAQALFTDPHKVLYMIYGMLITIAGFGLLTLIVSVTGRSIVPPLLRVIPQEITLPEPVCPGDIVSEEVELSAERPTVVDLNSAVYDMQARRIIVGTERSISSPVPEDLNTVPLPIEFEVPDVEAGSYRWVGAVTPKSRYSEIAFLNIYLEIEECGQ